jgi:hypothetical protein
MGQAKQARPDTRGRVGSHHHLESRGARAASTHSVPVGSRAATTIRIVDVASYWLIVAATYMTFGFLFYYLLLGLLEGLVFIVIAASVLIGEFLPTRRKPILLSGLGLAIFAFGLMSFAENMIGEFSTVAELFSYLTGTGVLIVLVLLMPPYRATIGCPA